MFKSSGSWALLSLRLVIGFGFAAHGFSKLSAGPEKFAGMLQMIGVPAPGLLAWATALIEFCGGLAVLAGAFVAIVSVPLVIIMLVAMFMIHLPNGFSAIKLIGVTASGPQFGSPGVEVNLLYIAGLIVLAGCGAGALSIDRTLAERKQAAAISASR